MCSMETVIYLNLRIGRESLNADVLRRDLSGCVSDGSGADPGVIPPASGTILMDGGAMMAIIVKYHS